MNYFWNILISIDQFFNTVFGGNPDETISSRLGKKKREGSKFASFACSILNLAEDNHCEKSIEEDEV